MRLIASSLPVSRRTLIIFNWQINLQVAAEAPLDLESTLVYQLVEVSQSLFHPVSELSQEVLELEDTPKHVPVALGLDFAAAELAEPLLDTSGRSVSPLFLVDTRQLHMQVACRASLLVKRRWKTDYIRVKQLTRGAPYLYNLDSMTR